MIFFLFVPLESGRTEMAALAAQERGDALLEASGLPFAGRTGYLFDGDQFVEAVRTAGSLAQASSFAAWDIPAQDQAPPLRQV